MTNIPFTKMHGTGNQILIVDNRDALVAVPTPAKLRELADPGRGPGFDQLMWIEAPATNSAIARYRVFNSDGGEAEQCGNGLRCIAWLLAGDRDASFQLESPAGIVTARRTGETRTSVSMGRPAFAPSDIPFVAGEEQLSYTLQVGSDAVEIAALSMGNPHCVLEVADTETAPVGRLGPLIEAHERFPARVNVGFRQIVSPGELRLRVFERGAGETLACGTGACAAAVSGMRQGKLKPEVRVHLPGGELMVSWHGDDVWLTGDVKFEHQGSINL